MDTAFEVKKTYVHDEARWSLYNQQEIEDMKNENELKYKMLATVDIDTFLADMFESGEQDIDSERDEMEKSVRMMWHFIRKLEEGYKDGGQEVGIRGGCGGDDDDETQTGKDPKRRKHSHPGPGLSSQENLETGDVESETLWPSSELRIPGSSDKVPYLDEVEGKADRVPEILPEYLELTWWVLLLRFHQDITLIQSLLVLFGKYLQQSKG